VPFPLPRGEQRLDMAPLLVAERKLRKAAPCFFRIVVRDRGFESLSERRRLRELAAEPAEESHRIGSRRGHSFFT